MMDFNKLAEEYPKRKDFYTVGELNEFVKSSVSKYYNIEKAEDKRLIANITTTGDDGVPNVPQVQLRYSYHDRDLADTAIFFNLTQGENGLYPFNDTQTTKKILKNEIESFQINYTFYMTSVDHAIHDERVTEQQYLRK